MFEIDYNTIIVLQVKNLFLFNDFTRWAFKQQRF